MPRQKGKKGAKRQVKNQWLMNCRESKERDSLRHSSYGGPYPDRSDAAQPVPDWVWVWMNDMAQWGHDVREDIRRIEKHLRLAAGDPGDPPPPPPDNN